MASPPLWGWPRWDTESPPLGPGQIGSPATAERCNGYRCSTTPTCIHILMESLYILCAQRETSRMFKKVDAGPMD